ncbi:MAG: glycoside hydrolase family 78 protein, partial [Alicyclobacillus herbarius]|uniref:alpha-L-rhamnosidase n=1 Tax=Alicyclobacillus herbarius TaxID=122960 RepID=UPI0023531CF6
GLLNSDEWRADWITPEFETADVDVCPLLRKAFAVHGEVVKATIYATSLGLYELYVNGQRVGDLRFTPGWTSYHKRIQYQTYDVTHLLAGGTNVLGAYLGNGWYRGRLGWKGKRNIYGEQRALLVQLRVCYADGRVEWVCSDETWKARQSPILISEIYDGEVFDARLDDTSWAHPEYDDTAWSSVRCLPLDKSMLIAQENLPTRIVETIQPSRVLKTPRGETVLDMGQNMVGWVRFTVTAPRGTEIVLEHAEVLDKEGNFYTGNLRTAKQTIRYICRGGAAESFEPHFTFQGFRYVRISGWPGEVDPKDFVGCVIHTDLERTGTFECSNPLVNQLQHNILWGQKGNFVDVPTDCPQRDERLGWTGDAQVFIRTAAFNMNVAPFFTKWLRDLKTDQYRNGGVPPVIPNVLEDEGARSSAAWADAAVICPWVLYECYGDKKVLEEQYESMKALVEYMRRQGENEYLFNTGFHFGDWLGLDAKEGSYKGATPDDYVATCFYAYSTSILAKTARVLGKEHEAKRYEKLFQNIAEAFRREYVTPSGRLAVPTQTAHVLALWFGLLEPGQRQRCAETLAALIQENNNHLTTGFVGTPYLCHALTESGYNDLAYRLLLQTDFPSWLYEVEHGATTIWEHWDSIKPDGSFWSDDMNSFNHYAYGAIGDWMYRVIAGINTDIDAPGYKHIHIRPRPERYLEYAKGSLETMYGEVVSAWRRTPEGLEVNVSIPANTTATVVLPFAKAEAVLEGEHPLADQDGILRTVQTPNGVQVEVGSGSYVFTYPC